MMFPRDTILYFLAVAEYQYQYATATKSTHDNHQAIVHKKKEAAIAQRFIKSDNSKLSLSDLDDILKKAASASDKDVLQSTLRALKELVEADPTCHTGEVADVIAACQGCCTEKNSCSWNGAATICDGACAGDLACKGIPTNSVIMNDSCCGFMEACDHLGGNDGADEFIPVFIGPGSCAGITGAAMCSRMGSSAETVVVASESCEGSSACEWLGKKTAKSIFVGANSCQGEGAICSAMAQDSADAAIFIGSEACRGFNDEYAYSCESMAQKSTSLTLINIADGACDGVKACSSVGYRKASIIAIGPKSCLGRSSCAYIGLDAATNVSIGGGACHGDEACYNIGHDAATSVVVEDYACIEEDLKCKNFSNESAGPVVVAAANPHQKPAQKQKKCTVLPVLLILLLLVGGMIFAMPLCVATLQPLLGQQEVPHIDSTPFAKGKKRID